MEASIPTIEERRRSKVIRLSAQQIIENNKKIIEENNLKSWEDIHNFTLKTRLANKENINENK